MKARRHPQDSPMIGGRLAIGVGRRSPTSREPRAGMLGAARFLLPEKGAPTMNDHRLATEGVRERALAARRQRHSVTGLLTKARLDVTPAQEAKIADRLLEMPVSYRIRYLRAMKGRNPTLAIQAFCRECTGWARAESENCTAPACPLYPYRPQEAATVVD